MQDPTPTSRPSLQPGPDGIVRHADHEAILNQLAVATFGNGSGKEFLRYLRTITVNSVCGPEISDAGLRHREGMRALVGIIETRVDLGGQKHEHPQSKPARRSRTAAAGGPA